MNNPSIYFSCIVTCFNREEVIERAIKSILNQSFQNFEIIVVDDSSIDQSIAKIETIKDTRIKLIKNKKNGGQNFALNVGIRASNFDYLAFLDSDDEWHPGYLMEMFKIYQANPTIGFAYSNFADELSLSLEGNHKYPEVLNQGFLSSMISITAKKAAVVQVGKFDERYTICQDDDFGFRLAKDFSFKVIKQKLVMIHNSYNSLSNNELKSAEGWEFLFNNYKDDIIQYCGHRTLSKHTVDLSFRFFRCKRYKKGIIIYWSSLINYIKGNKSKKFKYPFSEFQKITFAIIKLNLGHLKRKLFK